MAQTVAGVGVFAEVPDRGGETERLCAALAASQAECAALADALGLLTHEHTPPLVNPHDGAWCRRCGRRADDPQHRTAAWIRATRGFGAA
jgi:hypothetical protein